MASYGEAVRDARWHDAATDPALHSQWREARDPLARALLILAAAHLHASQGNPKGAVAKLERAQGYLEKCDGPFAERLRKHTESALEQAPAGDPLPPLPLQDPPPKN